MTYPPLYETVHISSTSEANPSKVWSAIGSLCGGGYNAKGEREMVSTLADLVEDPLADDEELCKDCLAHPDYPLLVLADVGE
jgi:hypothetical protein